ncbi:MAG: DciA family protein, partial [Mangrovicoccus sp.]
MQSPPKYKRGKRGFQAAGRLVEDRIKKASASRGFAMERLLTHWSEVVGPELANICSPVSVTYKRKGGFGA